MSWIIQRVGQHWGKLLWEEAELLHFPRQSFTKEKWIWCQWEEGQMCPTLMLSPTHQSLSHSQMHGRNPGTCFFSILAARVKPTLFLLNLGQRHFGKSKLSRLICKHTTVVDLLFSALSSQLNGRLWWPDLRIHWPDTPTPPLYMEIQKLAESYNRLSSCETFFGTRHWMFKP